jgi:hypothetical protein
VAKDRQQIIEEFDEAVNMTRNELEDWLQTDESQSVGQSDNGGESKGHESGRKIVEILEKNKSDYTDEDVDHMQRVVSYVHRHQAQEPSGDLEGSTWR